MRDPSPEEGREGWPRRSRCCASAPRRPRRRTPPNAKLLARKEELEQQIDQLKYQKAAMAAGRVQEAAAALLLELARTQEELDK